MRAGACTLQQTLTSEAASVLKHSLSLARRRGHAQVTPLHVAATLLSSKVSLLRRACLKSQPHQASHPLQCRALELCFNVALNRLPTIPGPLLHGQPSLSNALIAALKRAQAHQRRGCIEQQQQQPLLAIKVELEQLILSILDDPSVSRVMREAGFSSTAVKNNLEDCSVSSVFQCYNSSGGIYSTPSSPPSETTPVDFIHPSSIWHSPFLSYSSAQNQIHFSPQKKLPSNLFTYSSTYLSDDIKLLEEMMLLKKRRNTVIVGDSLFITENLVAEFMAKVERGDVPEGLKSVHIIKFHFSAASLRVMKKDEVEVNISDLKRKVEHLVSVARGVIIYIGDLKWTVETLSEGENESQVSCYSPVDHLVSEIGKLLSLYNSSDIRFWLLATANYQTYMRCQMKQPALDIQWALQAVSVPSGGLGLSLNAASVQDTSVSLSQSKNRGMETKPFTVKEEQDFLTCCPECTSDYEKELASKSVQPKSCNDRASNDIPNWLNLTGTSVAEKEYSFHLKRKWSKLCQSLHQRKPNGDHLNNVFGNLCSLGKNYSYNSYQWWPSYKSTFLDTKPISFANTSLKPSPSPNSVPHFRRQQSCHIEFDFSNGHSKNNDQDERKMGSLKDGEDKEAKITLALGSSLLADGMNSAEQKSNNGIQDSAICELLKENVPWQSKYIPRISEALTDSGKMRKDIWLLFQGNDSLGKHKLAMGIAKAVFGSTDMLFDINIRNTGQYREILENALRYHDRLIVFLENIESADAEFLKFLADGWKSGTIGGSSENEENTRQTIFILTKMDAATGRDARGKRDSVIGMKLLVDETTALSRTFSFDHKRKAEWDLTGKTKSTRQDSEEDAYIFAIANGKKMFTSQSSPNILDLNVKAEEEEHEREIKQLSMIPVSSDHLTPNPQDNPLAFLDLIKNRFILNRDPNDDIYIREMILSKIKGSFEKVFGSKSQSCFAVEGNVLEEIFLGSGSFLDSFFENWLKDIFETSLISIGRKEGINIRLCLGSNGDQSDMKEGFVGSCLPKSVQVSFLN